MGPFYRRDSWWCAIHDIPKLHIKTRKGKMVKVDLVCSKCQPPNNPQQPDPLPHTDPRVEWDDENLINDEGGLV